MGYDRQISMPRIGSLGRHDARSLEPGSTLTYSPNDQRRPTRVRPPGCCRAMRVWVNLTYAQAGWRQRCRFRVRRAEKMMRVSLGHRFRKSRLTSPVFPSGGEGTNQQAQQWTGQLAVRVDLDFVVVGRSARAALANGRRPTPGTGSDVSEV